MSDLFQNHIVGFPKRRFIFYIILTFLLFFFFSDQNEKFLEDFEQRQVGMRI